MPKNRSLLTDEKWEHIRREISNRFGGDVFANARDSVHRQLRVKASNLAFQDDEQSGAFKRRIGHVGYGHVYSSRRVIGVVNVLT
ncbi:MAG: hypothetical protein WCI02_00485 [Planctomycetota bacterium]